MTKNCTNESIKLHKTQSNRLRIGFLMIASEFTHSTPVTYDIMYHLQDRGVEVVPIIPEIQLIDLQSIEVDCDLYVLRPSAEIILSLAGVLHRKGACILNDYQACVAVRDKVQVAASLLQAGLPFPKSYATGDIAALQEKLQLPLIIKPERGALGEGISIVNSGDRIPPIRKGGYFVQEYLETNHYDFKAYVIGKEVMLRKRHFPSKNNDELVGIECSVTTEIRDLALACGKILNLEIYGVDIIQTNRGLMIVDVNYFPSFLGIPDVAEKLANYIYQYALINSSTNTKKLKC